jgi:Ca2+/Na+ antiporter
VDIVALVALGLGIVAVTRFVLCRGIDDLADAAGLSSKLKGQILGYSTSVPELVGTVSTAALGLLGAGLWNVAASNIINLVLFLSAAIFYRQGKELLRAHFIDEIGFAVGAIAIPVLLVVGGGAERSIWTAVGLWALFFVYLLVDRRLNPKPKKDLVESGHGSSRGSKPRSAAEEERSTRPSGSEERGSTSPGPIALPVTWIVVGLAAIVVLGRFLGSAAEGVVQKHGVPQMAVGWIMGVLTSLPELTTFFAIYATAKRKGTLHLDEDTQEATDNLAASNMSNLGIIYPLGIVIFLLAGYG